jgi:site-specific recombinase XerD
MDSGIVPIPPPRELARAGLARLPAAIVNAGERARKRFIEFFAANIHNPNTRRAYLRALLGSSKSPGFFNWCERRGIAELSAIEPFHVAAYIADRGREAEKPTVKQELAAIRMLFDWLILGQIVPMNPAAAVRGPKHVVRKGKTPILSPAEARQLLDSIDVSTAIGLRDRALIATELYTFGRVTATISLNVEDCYVQERRLWLRLHEKNGKVIEMPCNHNLEQFLHEYIDVAGIGDAKTSPLFRTAYRKTKTLTDRRMSQKDVWSMIRRRARQAGIETELGSHSMRGTGITAYLMNSGTLDAAQRMAGHSDPRTTKLYDRRGDQVSLDDVERISF